MEDGKTLSEGVLVVQGVTDTNYVDESFSSLPNGTSVEYAVVANYFSGQSEAAWSNAIVKNSSGVGSIDVDNPVVRLVVVNVAGIIVYDGEPDDFDAKVFTPGVYVVKEIHVDNNVTTSKIIVKN